MRRTVHIPFKAEKGYYDRIWEAVPCDAELPLFGKRLGLVLAEIGPRSRVLDLGCGDGRFAAEMAKAGANVSGVDVASEPLRRARAKDSGLDLRQVEPGGRLPFLDGEFDCIFCSEVIGQVVDTAWLLSEARRVLRSGGRLVLTTPYHGRLQSVLIALFGYERHYSPWQPQLRFFTKRSLTELLQSFGFEKISTRAVGGPPALRHSIFCTATRGTYAGGVGSGPGK